MKYKKAAGIVLLMVVLLASACGIHGNEIENETGNEIKNPEREGVAEELNEAYQKITAEEGKDLMATGEIIVVDVRRMDEYEEAHIPGAISIPNEEIQDTRAETWPALDEKVLVYCRTGVRSKEAAKKLVDMGYQQVLDMGGIVDWPYETIKGKEPGVFAAGEEK